MRKSILKVKTGLNAGGLKVINHIRTIIVLALALLFISWPAEARMRRHHRHVRRWVFEPICIVVHREEPPASGPNCEVIGPRLDGTYWEICDGTAKPVVTVTVDAVSGSTGAR